MSAPQQTVPAGMWGMPMWLQGYLLRSLMAQLVAPQVAQNPPGIPSLPAGGMPAPGTPGLAAPPGPLGAQAGFGPSPAPNIQALVNQVVSQAVPQVISQAGAGMTPTGVEYNRYDANWPK